MLTIYGWITTIIIALLILLSGLAEYIMYPILFLILGSLISTLNPKNRDNDGRSAKQVIANSGVSVIIAIIYLLSNNELCKMLFVISWSVAMSDTFSSEVGKRYGGRTIDIRTRSQITKGLSGGISLIGSLGGFLGSLIVAIQYYLHIGIFKSSIYILFFGFFGMIIDSLIGSKFQAKYQSNDTIKEEGQKSNLISGYAAIDNCMTNFLSIAATVILFFIYTLVQYVL